jgi:predicted secreted protein
MALMAQPTTAKFGKMQVYLGKFAGTDPAAVAVTSLSKTNPATCTVAVGDIGKFQNGMRVKIAGAVGTGLINANGTWVIGSVGTPANQFTLLGCDTSAGAAPQTTGVTADPPQLVTYFAPCGLTTKGLQVTKNLQEDNIPDCTNPDAPTWIARSITNFSVNISGDGLAAAESVGDWNAACMNTSSVPMKVVIDFGGTITKTFEGLFIIDQLTFGAELGGRVTLAINAQSDGQVVDTFTGTLGLP